VLLGVVAYLVWSKAEKTWPFGPKQIREEYAEAEPVELETR